MLVDLKPKLDLCKKQTVGFGSIVEAINAARRNAERVAARCPNLTLLLGALFADNKLIEY